MMKPCPLLPLLLALAAMPAWAAVEEEAQRELLQQKTRLEAHIDDLQQQSGRHAAELQETWFELGTTLQALDLHEEAASAFDVAWQSMRSNGGLEDPQQLTALRRRSASERAAGQWDKADTTAHLIEHISRRAHATGSPERLDAVLQLGRWKLLAARDDLLPDAYGAALEAAEIHGREIARLESSADYAGRNIQLATLHLERASAEFLLAGEVKDQPLQEYFVSGQRSSTMLQCSITRLPDGRAQQICVPVEVPNLDFYVDPANRKSQDMWRHLNNMRDNVAAAFGYLKQETNDTAARDALLADMQGLTESYNSFVTGNGL